RPPATRPDGNGMLATYSKPVAEPRAVVGPDDVIHLQKLAEAVHVEEDVLDYVLALTTFTRRHRRVHLGASPRAALALLLAAKARALLKGRDFVLPDDVKSLAPYVLAHRVLMAPEAELEGVGPATVVNEAVGQIAYRRRR